MNEPKNFTLLIVDDEPVLRDTIVFDFKRKGFNVLAADNGTQAFEMVKEHQIDLILSDIRMPGGDGLTLLEAVRRRDRKVPVVIFMTGFADVSEQDCIEKGANCVLPKPFDRKALVAAVMNALGVNPEPRKTT